MTTPTPPQKSADTGPATITISPGLLGIVSSVLTALVGGSIGYGAAPRVQIDTATIATKLEAADGRLGRFEDTVDKQFGDVRAEVAKLAGKLEALTEKRYTSDDARADQERIDRRIRALEGRVRSLEASTAD